MSLQPTLSERHQNILWATIQHYVATAEPVGSKTLAQEYGFQVSSATIRNSMGWLEKAGFLYQPHTSAGRVPSDSGYRVYVDQLMRPDAIIGSKIEEIFAQKLLWNTGTLEAILQRAAKILAAVSGYIALITMPINPKSQSLLHLQLVPLEASRVMLIVVTDSYETESIVMELTAPEINSEARDEAVMAEELEILSNFLNSKLRGQQLAELGGLDWGQLDREFAGYADFIEQLQTELSLRAQPPGSTPILVRGFSEVLRQPEFSQLQQVQTLIQLLEEGQNELLPLIFESSESEATANKVSVTIGSENPLEPMQSCTLVSAIYHQGKIPVGSVGVIGPTRMLYENAIALVEAAANYLSVSLS